MRGGSDLRAVPAASAAAAPVARPSAAAHAGALAVLPVAAAVSAAVAPVAAALAGVGVLLLVAGADLLGRDLGAVLGLGDQLQRDAPALGVHLGDLDGDDVALRQHLLDGVDADARRDPRDVQQAVGALADLDERAEVRGLDHAPVRVDVADADGP